MNIGQKLVHSVEKIDALDGLSQAVIPLVQKAVQPTTVRNLLSGSLIGHPLHPLLTDVPIGAWTMSTLLDVVGGRKSAPAADLLVKVGILGAVPTAASGLNDWSDTYGDETRIGAFHAAGVSTALLLYTGSAWQRHKGHRARGKLMGLLGLAALTTGGYLGGHLSFVKGVNVNATAHIEGPEDWTAVLPDAELADGEHKLVDAGGTAVLLYRERGSVYALANTCSHMGGPLNEGSFADGCVTCPWHGSIFRMSDGSIVRGPAATTQPSYTTRVNDGQIEVKA